MNDVYEPITSQPINIKVYTTVLNNRWLSYMLLNGYMDKWLATERAGPLPYGVQPDLPVEMHCTWVYTWVTYAFNDWCLFRPV